MKTSTIIKLVVWFVLSIVLLNIGLEMITAPNTIENMIGILIVAVILIISIKTKCLTLIKLERRHEK